MRAFRVQIPAALGGAVLLAAMSSPAASGSGPRLLRSGEEAGPGRVVLSLSERQPGDPEDSLRLEALVRGPLEGEDAGDLYAFNAVLAWPPGRLEYLPGSVRRGDLLGSDGRDWLITAAPAPGVAAPKGLSSLFSVAIRVQGEGPVPLTWKEAAFIDSRVRALDVARFEGATLVPASAPGTPAEETP